MSSYIELNGEKYRVADEIADALIETVKRLEGQGEALAASAQAYETALGRIAELKYERDVFARALDKRDARIEELEEAADKDLDQAMKADVFEARIAELEAENERLRPVEEYPCAGWSVLHTKSVTPSQPININELDNIATVTPKIDVTDANEQKAPPPGHCYGVTVEKEEQTSEESDG